MIQRNKLTKEQWHIIRIVTIGGMLEWYEIYSFVYLAPILAKLFFNFDAPLINSINVYLLFGIGFVSRPFGAILFGRIGDLVGRKNAFMYSIIIMTIPTFLMGCLPTYSTIGILAPILFYFLRFTQSIPAAGEMPGTICFLYENSKNTNIRFMTSWAFVGNQIGAMIALSETIILDHFVTEEIMLLWGWRILFWSGGLLGLFAIYLRSHLHETPIFSTMKDHHDIDKETVVEVVENHKKTITLGVGFGAILAIAFYLFATYIPSYIQATKEIKASNVTIWMLILVFIMTCLIPLVGMLGDKYSSKKILLFNSFLLVVLLPFIYYAINTNNLLVLAIAGGLCILPIASISALYPYWVAHIFKPKVRYTSVGLAFNIADGFIGAMGPAIALFLMEISEDKGAFCWYVLCFSLISIIAFFKIREPDIKKSI